jgi:hypothetical protein
LNGGDAVSTRAQITGIVVGVVVALSVAVAVVALVRTDMTGESGSGLGEQFDYDMDVLRVVDPALVKYRRSFAFDTGLAEARAIAVDLEGRILVGGDRRVVTYDERGEVLGRIGLDGEPTCVAVDRDGTLYVGVRTHVQVFGADGKRAARWPVIDPETVLTSIAVYEDNVFLADAGERIVRRYDREGRLLNTIGAKDPERNIPGFVVPSPYFDLAVSSDGLLRVANPGRHRIEAYTFDGDLELWWGKPSAKIRGFCGCCNPSSFAILPDGSYVTAEKGLTRVKAYDERGTFACVVAPPSEFGEGAGGPDVCVDARGRVLVLDPMRRRVSGYERIASKGAEGAGP